MTVPEITVHELKQLLDHNAAIVLLDVRSQDEYDFCNLNGLLIPLDELPNRLQELDTHKKIIVHCRSGSRSKRAVELLHEHGFKQVYNLQGGILAWAHEIDTEVPTY